MQTETIEVTLPIDLIERIRDRVRSGEFASESDVVVHRLTFEEDDWSDLPFETLPFDPENPATTGTEEDWLRHVVPQRLQEIENGSEKTVTTDEVRSHFAALKAARLAVK